MKINVYQIFDSMSLVKIISKIKTNIEFKRLFENFLSLTILQVLNYLLPLITFPYLVRVLGVEKFGLLSFATATINYFLILTDYGFNLSATREIAIYRDNKEKTEEILSSVIIIKLGLLGLSLIILSILVFSFEKFRKDWFIYYLTFGMVLGHVLFPVWFFQGIERMRYITILNIIAKGFFTFMIFILIKKKLDYWKVPILNSMGFILAGLLSLYFIKKNFKLNIKLVNFLTLKKYFLDSSQFFLSRISVSIYTSSNAFVLGIFTNNTMVGYYSMAEKLYHALQQIYFPITQVLYPYIANTKNSLLFKKIFKTVFSVNTVLTLIIFIFSRHIFDLLFSNEVYLESIIVFRILLIALLVVVPSILLGYPFLAAMGYPEYANKSVIYGSLIHIFGLFVLGFTKYINIYSISIMVIISEIFVFVYRIYFSKKINT